MSWEPSVKFSWQSDLSISGNRPNNVAMFSNPGIERVRERKRAVREREGMKEIRVLSPNILDQWAKP